MTKINTNELHQFTGTETYYRFSPISKSVLTDGTQFVGEQGNFWLFDAIDSHLITKKYHNKDYFAVAKFDGKKLKIEDGNNNIIAKQNISNAKIEGDIFCSYDGEKWVYMLPSEY